MKKLIPSLVLIVTLSTTSFAQLQFGVKGGVNYNSDSFKNVSNDVLSGAKSKTGYHAGIWFQAKLPVIGLFLRPEVVYTNLKNEVTYLPQLVNATGKVTTYNFQKIDIPVLFGKKILSVGSIFAGPSFQYVLGSDFNISDLTEVKTNNFTLGVQFGAGLTLGKLGVDVRWERSLSNTETKFVNSNISENVNFDTRVNQIIFGLSYRL